MLEDALRHLGEGSGDGHVGDLAERVRLSMKDGDERPARVRDRDKDGNGRMYDYEKGVKMQAVENEVERVRSGEGGQAGEETEVS